MKLSLRTMHNKDNQTLLLSI